MTPVTLTLESLVQSIREWMADVRTHRMRMEAGEDSDPPAAFPHAFEAAGNGRVVRVLESEDIGAPCLFILAGPDAIAKAVEAGWSAAKPELEAEYLRGLAAGEQQYQDAPTDIMEWSPGTEP